MKQLELFAPKETVSTAPTVWRAADGRLFMSRCPRCRMENWSPAVASGQCAWCGRVASEDDLPGVVAAPEALGREAF